MKLLTCPVCGEETNNFMSHLFMEFDNPEHNNFIAKMIQTIHVERDAYSFMIAEKMCKVFGTQFDLEQLTQFVSKVIPMLGYSIRKRCDLIREVDTDKVQLTPTSEPWEGVKYVLLEISLPFKNIFGSPICTYCGKKNKDRERIFISPEIRTDLIASNVVTVCKDCIEAYNNAPYTSVTKSFTFAAGHHLPYHKGLCRFSHGHEWKFEVTIKRKKVMGLTTPNSGMVLDFSELKKVVNEHVVNILDHNYINDIMYNPTAENMCLWIWNTLSVCGVIGIDSIRVWETPTSFAEITLKDIFTYYSQK